MINNSITEQQPNKAGKQNGQIWQRHQNQKERQQTNKSNFPTEKKYVILMLVLNGALTAVFSVFPSPKYYVNKNKFG